MTVSFVDVKSGYWAYNEIMEAANTFLSDGTPLIEGLPYQAYEANKGYIYEEIKAGKNQVAFVLSKAITPSDSNPLYVYVDGVQYGYKNSVVSGGKTTVYLYTPPKQGSIVSLMSLGVPKLLRGRPIIHTLPYYPHYKLKQADRYVYSTSASYSEYLTVFGKKLKRIMLTPDDLKGNSGYPDEFDQNLARNYIGSKTDVYLISPSGRIHLPWNFEGMSGTITYAYSDGGTKKTTETFIAWTTSKTDTKHEPYHNDRFFPNVWVTRAEAVEFINKLRINYYERLTDLEPPGSTLAFEVEAYQGQKVFRLNGTYPVGKGLLQVFDSSKPDWEPVDKKKYKEFDDHTVLMHQPVEKGTKLVFFYEKDRSGYLNDVGRNISYFNKTLGKVMKINGTTDDWVPIVMALENEKLNDGSRLITGIPITSFYDPIGKNIPITDDYYRPQKIGGNKHYFMPHTPISRAETVGLVNRFRKWCLERFL